MGRGIALKLAEKGVNVAINYYQNEAAASDTLAQVQERGVNGIVIQADVCNPEDINRMFNKIQSEFGTLDIFVSNARPELPAFYYAPMDITLDSGILHSIPKLRRSLWELGRLLDSHVTVVES